MISTGVIAQHRRLVFASKALAREPVAVKSGVEFRRKIRVITQGLRSVIYRRALLNPFRYGFFAIQFFTHKLLRRLLVFPALLVCILSPLLWNEGLLYQAATSAEVTFLTCAATGFALRRSQLGQSRVFTVPYFICLVNVACLIAAANIVLGRQICLWEPERHSNQDPAGLTHSSPI